MASASDFLKKRTAARQQAESIQSSDKTPLGKNDDGTVTRASNFLRNKAAERRAVIDQQYGKDAYGGSGRYEADKAQGFNSWLESVNGLSSQLGSDYQSRDGKFQSAADFGKYRDDNDARISVMQNRANAYRTYFQDNREIYGEDAVNGVLSTLDQGSKYLEELRGGLNSEYDFWSQFKDENDYNTYQRGKEKDQPIAMGMVPDEEGYKVCYPDGYESFSPKAVFEEAYRPIDSMSFGLAIEAMKKGKKCRRAGWNGKNQHIELASAISYTSPAGTIVNAEHAAIGNKAIAFCGTSGVQIGWLASQADMLADDWEIVE